MQTRLIPESEAPQKPAGRAAPDNVTRPPWAHVIPAHEQEIYRAAGFSHDSGAGRRSALLVIDVQYRSIGERSLPILEAIREYATSCGEYGWRAVSPIAELIAVFREQQLPVIYPHVAPKGIHDGGRFAEKLPGVMQIPLRGYEFVAQVSPRAGDIELPKYHASAFFGTPLLSHLVNLGVDSVVIAGCTTSGCVRASAVDASQYGFKVVVPQECVFDRSQTSHAVNLFDLANKYADVMPLRDAIALLRREPVSPQRAR